MAQPLRKPTSLTQLLLWIVIAGMALYTAFAAFRMITITLADAGNIDFHSYWYDGVLFRYGINTFERHLNQTPPPLIEYIGGIKDNVPTIETLNIAPANPALGVIFFSILGNFHWDTAKVLWLIIDLIAMVAVPILLFQLLPQKPPLGRIGKIFIFLIFFTMLPVRICVGNGQLPLVTLCLMLLTILLVRRNQEILAGVVLAAAMVKFSVGTAVVLYLLYRFKWKAVVIGLALHIIGFVVYGLATQTPLDTLFTEHIGVLLLWRIDIGKTGVSVASLLPNEGIFKTGSLLLMTAITGLALARWYRPLSRIPEANKSLIWLAIFSLMTLYITLAIYHSYYDSLIVIASFAVIIYVINHADRLALSRPQSLFLQAFAVISVIIFNSPGETIGGFLFGRENMDVWRNFNDITGTIILIIAYGILLWLINRLVMRPQPMTTEAL